MKKTSIFLLSATLGFTQLSTKVAYAETQLSSVISPFITVWRTVNANEQIQVPLVSGDAYDFNVNWGDGTGETYDSSALSSINHTYASAGEHTVTITPETSTGFPQINFYSATQADRNKIIDIEQWGQGQWTSMYRAFYNCANLDVSAADSPNLTAAQNLSLMFYNDSSLVGTSSFDNWNTSNITDMSFMFYGASQFNQPLGDWDTANVTNMWGTFALAASFNQPIGNWNTAKVIDMDEMFNAAFSFNQPIGSWNTSKVVYMSSMFYDDQAFNQSLSAWNTGKVITVNKMFYNASAFNQSLANWDISRVTDMRDMFAGTQLSVINYDRTLEGWASQSGLRSGVVFNAGTSQYSQEGLVSRNQLINDHNWHISDGGEGQAYLSKLSISPIGTVSYERYTGDPASLQYQYRITNTYGVPIKLAAVNDQAAASSTVSPLKAVSINAAKTTCTFGLNATLINSGDSCVLTLDAPIPAFNSASGHVAYQNALSIEDDLGFTTTADQGFGVSVSSHAPTVRPFVSKWQTTSANETITLPLFKGDWYAFTVNWGDGSSQEYNSNSLASIQHTYAAAGVYTVTITPVTVYDFPRIYFNNNANAGKITDIVQWGNTIWASFRGAFYNCSHLDVTAADTPDLTLATDLTYMFRGDSTLVGTSAFSAWDTSHVTTMYGMFLGATAFNQPIGNWNTAKVTDMGFMFYGASAFNQDISNWNTANVTSMRAMFYNDHVFNQPIGNWNTAKVTDMSFMFYGASAFNQNISNWNTANVTSMYAMFASANSFDQPIGNWDTSNVTDMERMFYQASSFNQNIGSWNIQNLRSAAWMLESSGLTSNTYSSILQGWASQAPNLQQNVSLGAGAIQYTASAQAAHDTLTHDYGWNIADGGVDAS